MPVIKRIRIKNFRSIRDIELQCNFLTVLVGQNDAGKSNILRALDLFFNDQAYGFNFDVDHNTYDNPVKAAKEISIEIDLELPDGFRKVNGDFIRWKKTWREGGLHSSTYKGCRKGRSIRGNTTYDFFDIPGKSHAHTLLKRINYLYVPAIKDAHYFDTLRGQIYALISQVAAESFKQSSQSFETAIADHLNALTTDIGTKLGLSTKLALPKDLTHVFERLDFLSGDQEISLDQRGDGIKARHIPVILKFLTEQRKATQGQGAVPYTFFWAYEEPENNVELSKAFEMANEFYDYMADDIARVFITTHSPAFYNLEKRNSEDNERVSLHHIYMESPEEGSSVYDGCELDYTDNRMGILRLIAPHIEEKKREIEQLQARIKDFDNSSDSPRIFVEGESDRIVFQKALELFGGENAGKIIVETKTPGGGHNYVKDHLIAWHHLQKHNEHPTLAVGVFDHDKDARDSKEKADEQTSPKSGRRIVKTFLIPKTKCLIEVLSSHYKVEVSLEHLAPPSVWQEWKEKGWLKELCPDDVFPTDYKVQILNGEKNKDYYLNSLGEKAIYVTYAFGEDNKINAAKDLILRDDVQDILMPLKRLLEKEIIPFLFPE